MTKGWSEQKVSAFRDSFYQFLMHIKVNSKEKGQIILGEHIYRAQHRFFDAVFDALQSGVHDIKHLKSRQLGVSTASRALTLFWIGIHGGLKGYMIFDTSDHKEEARIELTGMIKSLPNSVKFPRILRENRSMVELDNGSMINFATAGVKQTKTGGTLGRGSGVNFVHASEMCSWDNIEGLESFRASLAEDFPNRLYIWESTGRGYNSWHSMVEEAKSDPAHQKFIFSGWWAKDNQQIPRGDPEFALYTAQPLTDIEKHRIREVKDRYGWEITAEQIAWIRRKMNPATDGDDGEDVDYEPGPLKLIEQPWTEDEAFQMTGATFFDPEVLKKQMDTHVSRKFKAYSYQAGIEFTDMKIFPARTPRSIELRVWEEPVEDSVYVISADPAFGHDESNDRSAIQVLRCFSDGIDQVAEYAWPLITSNQFAWVIASLEGWYGGQTSQVYRILEINGPGESTFNELQTLRRQLLNGYFGAAAEEKGLQNVQRNVRNYIYTRSDSMGPGFSYQFKTSQQLKVAIMERLRDFTSNGMLHIRSPDTLEEMRAITRTGDEIRGQGVKKDDRVMALAMAVRCWEDRARRGLITQKKTRSNDEFKRRMTVKDQVNMFNDAALSSFFENKSSGRRMAMAAARRLSWRGR